MKARDFLKLAEQETIQVLPPFDIESIKQEFSKKAEEFEYSGITISEIAFNPDGTTLTLQQGNVSAQVTFSYSEDVGAFVAIKPSSGESVNLDLTTVNPPIINTNSLSNQIDMSNLTWMSKEAFEAICAACQIKEIPDEGPVSDLPPEIGSDGSGAATPTSQQPQSAPIELDAKTVPAPTPQGQPSGTLPGESYNEKNVGQDVMVKCDDCGYTASEYEFLLDTEKELACPECDSQYVSDVEVEEGKKREAKEAKVKTSDLPDPVQHQIEIAKKTLKMADPMVAVMGGMTKVEASEILKKYGLLKGESIDKALPGIKAEALYRVTFQKGKDTGVLDIEAASETEAQTKAKGQLKTDQKVLSVGKPTKKTESKKLTYFRFVERNGKTIKIPVGTNSALIEAGKKKGKQLNKVVSAKPFKPGAHWHSQKEGFGKPKTDDERKKRHLSRFGTDKLPPRGTGKKEVYGYTDDDDSRKPCPRCANNPNKNAYGMPKPTPGCPVCKGTGFISEGLLREQQVTKKFFIAMANFIKGMPDQISKKELVDEMIKIFQGENPRFDAGRFKMACGVS